jgi:hypothetical protein
MSVAYLGPTDSFVSVLTSFHCQRLKLIDDTNSIIILASNARSLGSNRTTTKRGSKIANSDSNILHRSTPPVKLPNVFSCVKFTLYRIQLNLIPYHSLFEDSLSYLSRCDNCFSLVGLYSVNHTRTICSLQLL